MCSPSGSTDLSLASPSMVVSRRPSSWETTRVSSVGLPVSLSMTGASSGSDLALEATLVDGDARLALRLAPNASRSSRPRPRLRAIRSAPSNWFGMSMVHDSGRGSPAPGGTLAPSGMRLIDSTPQAMPTLMVPGLDHVVDQVRGLLAGTALGVDRGRAGGLGESCVQPRAAHHVVGLLTGLRDAAADHLFDQRGVDPGATEHLGQDVAEQLPGVYAGQPAVALAERSADGVDDDGVSHGPKLEHVLVLGKRLPFSSRVRGFRTNREYVKIRH